MNSKLENHATELQRRIKEKYDQLPDTALSIQKNTLVRRIWGESGIDAIEVANALAYFESARSRNGYIRLDLSNDHLLVINTLPSNRRLYFSVADILRLVPPIHIEPTSPANQIGG